MRLTLRDGKTYGSENLDELRPDAHHETACEQGSEERRITYPWRLFAISGVKQGKVGGGVNERACGGRVIVEADEGTYVSGGGSMIG